MKRITFSLILVFLFNFPGNDCWAKKSSHVAVVIKIRGKVTQLVSPERIARIVKLGDKLKEDTSILTYKNSFIEIKFSDKSVMSLGPQSKAVIVRAEEGKSGVVSLLKGQARARVKRSSYDEKNKFFIKTRSAALGVGEADFQTVYNPNNQLTSLLTYEGQVAIAKYESAKGNLKYAKHRVVRDDQGRVKLEREPTIRLTSEKELSLVLEGDESVVAKSGQHASTVKKLGTVSQPVKINSTQLNLLYKNTEFRLKKSKDIKAANLSQNKKQVLRAARQKAPPEGVFDPEEKLYAPKAGGLVDSSTGFYIPPSRDALFDQKSQVYRTQKAGYVDSRTGQYKAPRGLKLDSVKGFVTDKKNGKLLAEYKREAKRLNDILEKELIVGQVRRTVNPSFKHFTNRELIAKNNLSIGFLPYSQTLEVNNDSFTGDSRTYKPERSRLVQIVWDHSSGSRWQPTTSFSFGNFELNEQERRGFEQVGTRTVGFMLGLKYSLFDGLELLSEVNLQQSYYLNHQTSSTGTESQFIRVTVPNINFGLEARLVRGSRYNLDFKVGLGSNLGKEAGTFKVKSGFSLFSTIENRFWLSRKTWLSLEGHFLKESQKVENTSFTADVERSTLGGGLYLGFVL